MKKVLQQTLFRLQALLLLTVMFVAGNSAWAQITFDLSKGTQTKDGVTVTAPNYDGSKGVELWGGTSGSGYTLTISSPETPIERVEFSGVVKYANGYTIDMDSSEGGFEGATTGSSINWVKTESVKSIIFTANKTGDYNTRNNIDFYVKTAVVYLEEAGNFVDFNYSSANGGEKGFYSLSSDALTFDAPVTVEKNLKIDGSNVTSATANGNVLNVNFSEINTPGIHTLTVPKGALRIGEDLNKEFSVTYTLVQDPNYAYGTFNFKGAGIPYTNNGVDKTLNSGNGLNTGDVFTSNDVLLTFTNANKDIAWSNNAQRLRLGQGTTFTIAAPDGFEITKIVFKTDYDNIQLGWNTGNYDYGDWKTTTWTGNATSLDFRASYLTYLQTIDVTCVKLAEVEYEVGIYKGTEFADDDWTVTVNGVDGTFKNSDTFTTGKKITAGDVVAPHHDGYHDAEVSIEDWGGSMIINVTYAVFEPINYTVDFSDNAPAGATVTIDGQEFSGDDTYPVAKDLDYYSVTAVDAPAGWYADYYYNEANHTFTFDFKQYINYSVVVEGAPAGQGGVVYNYETYGAGENVLPAKSELTASSVSAADVDGYAGTVSLDDHTFTVSYKKETIVIIPTSTASGVVGGINVSSKQENSEVNLYGSGTGYLKLTTSDLKIVKVQLVCKATSYTGTSNGGGANLYNLGQYVFVTDCDDAENTITSDGQNVEWTGNAKTITFTASYDFHLSSIKVWVEEAEVEPRSNVMDVASTYFSTGNVEQINSNLTFVADVNTEGEHSGAYGSSTEVPDGVTLVDGNSVSYTISSMQWWDNDSQVVVNLPSAITTPGDYTLTIPEGVIPCVGNKANKEIVFEWTIAAPTTYTVTFAAGAPAGASVTIDGNTCTENTTFTSKRELDENSANVKDVEGYEAHVAYDESNKEFTITYTALEGIDYYVLINPKDDANLKIRINGKECGAGTYTFYKEITIEDIEAPEYEGYYANPTVEIEDVFITVTYTAFPTLAIGVNASDNEGNYWTSFSFEKPISLPEDVTPCIVTGAENGVLTVQEFETVNNEVSVFYDFQNNGVEKIGNSLYIEGNNHDVSMTISGSTVFQSINPGQGRIEGAGSVTISHPENISKVIVTPWGGGFGANVSLDGADPVDVGTESYTFEVNATSCTLGLTSNGNGVYIFAIEVVVGSNNLPVIPANTGILVKSSEAISKIPYTIHADDAETVDVTGNLLVAGCDPEAVWNDANKLFYKLSWKNSSYEDLGFYWGVEGGHSITPSKNKAYLVLDASTSLGSNRAAYVFGQESELTGIDAVENELMNDAPIFDLQGKRVVAPKAGVYVKNGRKLIVK